ncbi:IclR family transcriptional regulator [Aestuariimicrobium soli]|uniref:IclR family transcriptional regulator n=1 Tax=Aestuariimicrobium soli TaxID=2035834 RepID=UPI003EBE99D3
MTDGATTSDLKPNYHTHALTRGLRVLEIVAASTTPTTLGEVHELSGMPKSTIVRLFATLTDSGYLVKVDDRPSYSLGSKVAGLVGRYTSTVNVADLARPVLLRLAAATNQTANLGTLDGVDVVHVAVEAPDRPLRYDTRVGDRAPVFRTGLGKAILATLPTEQVALHLPPEPWQAGHQGVRDLTRAELMDDLERTRGRGHAFDDNEYAEGLRCLAVPLATDGRVWAAVSVSGASGEFTEQSRPIFVRLLKQAAQELADNAAVLTGLVASVHVDR